MPSVSLALTDSIQWPPCCPCPSCGQPYARPKGGHWRTFRTLTKCAFDRFPYEDDKAKPPLLHWGWRVKQVTIAQATIRAVGTDNFRRHYDNSRLARTTTAENADPA